MCEREPHLIGMYTPERFCCLLQREKNLRRQGVASLVFETFHRCGILLTLNCQSQQLWITTCDFQESFCKQWGPRSDCCSRSSLIWVHTVCLYAKIGLKSLQEYLADDVTDDIFRCRFSWQFKDYRKEFVPFPYNEKGGGYSYIRGISLWGVFFPSLKYACLEKKRKKKKKWKEKKKKRLLWSVLWWGMSLIMWHRDWVGL